MSFLDYLGKFGWLLSLITSGLVGLAVTSLRKSFASKDDIKAVNDHLAEIDTRVAVIEQQVKDTDELTREVHQMARDVSGLSSNVQGMQREVSRATELITELLQRLAHQSVDKLK